MKNIIYSLSFIVAFFSIVSTVHAQTEPYVEDCLQLKGVVKNNVNIFSKPSDTSYERSVAEKFTILFMFQIPGTETAEKNGFLYVGKTPKQAIGYVKASEVVKWNHRLCVNFTDMAGRQPALVYGDYNELKGEDWDKNKIPNSNAIAQEPTAKPSIKLDMMMPVLEQKSLCQKGSYQDCQQAYKIGFLAGRDIEKEVIKEEVGSTNLDMMFLIDATGSMGEEIDGAKQIVEEIAKGLSSDKTVRFGITLYKDKGDEYITKQVLSLTNSYRSVTSTLSKIEASGGDDLPEAMFPGVSSAIKNTNWRKADKDAVLRVVIIIGDASGHDYTDYNKDDLITEASDNKVRFIALKVNSENPGDNRTHEGQLKDLTQGLRDGDKGLYLRTEAYTGELDEEYLKRLAQAIEEEIERMKVLEDVRSGAKDLKDVTPSNRAIFLKNLPKSGFADKGVRFNEGWVSERNDKGLLQTKAFVYMTRGELNMYMWLLDTSVRMSADPSKGLADLMANKISALTGETYDKGDNIDAHLQKVLCLPASGNDVLSFSLSDVARWSEKRRQTKIQTIDDQKAALDYIFKDVEKWRKPEGSAIEYTFIPLEQMP